MKSNGSTSRPKYSLRSQMNPHRSPVGHRAEQSIEPKKCCAIDILYPHLIAAAHPLCGWAAAPARSLRRTGGKKKDTCAASTIYLRHHAKTLHAPNEGFKAGWANSTTDNVSSLSLGHLDPCLLISVPDKHRSDHLSERGWDRHIPL